MAHNIKLIGIDLDGTLLHKKTVSDRNKQAICSCIEKGILVYLITGRPYCFAKYIGDYIDKRVKIISANGGIYEIGNQLFEEVIPQDALSSIIDVLEETNMKAFFKAKQNFYTHEPYDERFLYDQYNHAFSNEIQVHSDTEQSWCELKEHAHDIVKILVYDMNAHSLQVAREKIECLGCVEVTDYQSISFDITARDINKGNIIKKVLSELHLQKDEFMAIGDSNNDKTMLEEAGVRVAMGNASEEIKAMCQIETDSFDNDGVAHILESYILGKS